MNMIVLGLVLLLIPQVVTDVPDDVSDDVSTQELRYMLTSTMEQNRKLQLQNRRMKRIWRGIEQMCTAMKFKPTKDDIKDIDGGNHGNPDSEFRITHISSTGWLDDGCVELTARYKAPRQHSREWMQSQWRNYPTLFSGTKKTIKVGKTRYYTTTGKICKLILGLKPRLPEVYLRIYTANESISLLFNKTAIEHNSSQDLPKMSTGLLSLTTSYQAEQNEDLNVTIVTKGTVKSRRIPSLRPEISFQGLNTSSNPPSVFSIIRHNNIPLTVNERDDKTSDYVIELKSEYIKYGGILKVRLPHQRPLNGLVKAMYFGANIHVLSPSTGTVVPPPSFGVYELPKQTLLYEPSISIYCAAMGSPGPELTFLKRSKTGYEQKMETEEAVVQQYIVVRTLTLRFNRKAAGIYVCRASQGNRTVETTTEALVHVPVVFDDNKTAVMRNTTQKTVISCKASGKPRPELTFKTPSGTDLIASGNHTVSRSQSKKSSRIIVTISPVDTSLTHVMCSANQGLALRPSQRKIPVFPAGTNSTDYEYYYIDYNAY